jgi:argininosuccinate lyase
MTREAATPPAAPALWRQTQRLNLTFNRYNRCLEEDWFLLAHELRLQEAHARALAEAGLLTADQHADLVRGIAQLAADHLGKPCPESDAEDLHTWVEGALTALVGDAGRRIHTARSRNDQVATLLVMYARASGADIAKSLGAFIATSCRQAEQWSALAFPLQTHQQFAAPGTAGFWVLRYAATFDRILDHLELLVAHWGKSCPLGAGAVAGSTLPVDRRVQAEGLDFAAPSLNALMSTTTRDECLELLAVLAQIALHLQSFATDVLGFCQTPLGWAKYPAEFGTGSSMMPNKTNPDALELLRGEACAITTAHAHALTLLKGLPSGYNRDLQCIKPLVRDAVERTLVACALATELLDALDFDEERMQASLGNGHVDATARMEALVRDGIPLRDAHHRVAGELADTTENAQHASDVIHDYRTVGSASPAETRRIAAELAAKTHGRFATED